MNKKPVKGEPCVVLTKDHGKVVSTIDKIHGQWIYSNGLKWHFADDRVSSCVWKHKDGAIKVPSFKE